MGDQMYDSILSPAASLFVKGYVFAGKLIVAVLVFIIGWIFSKVIKEVIVKLLKMLKLDAGSEKVGIESFLAKGEIKYTLSGLIGLVIYWLIILVVLAGVISYMGFGQIGDILTKLIDYIPSVLAAIFAIIFGIFLATFLSSIVRATAANSGIEQSKSLGNVTQIIIMVFAVIVAIEQLKIDTSGVLSDSLKIILAAVGLAFALAVGLGCKDIAGEAISGFIGKMKKK